MFPYWAMRRLEVKEAIQMIPLRNLSVPEKIDTVNVSCKTYTNTLGQLSAIHVVLEGNKDSSLRQEIFFFFFKPKQRHTEHSVLGRELCNKLILCHKNARYSSPTTP